MSQPKQSRRINVATTTEGWYYIGMLAFIVAGAMIRDINLLYIMAGMMLGPYFFSWYASIKSLRRIQVKRRFPALVGVGDPLFVEIQATKPKGSPRAFATLIQDRVCRDESNNRSAVEAKLFFPTIRSGTSEDASYRVTLERRGRYKLGPMKVSTSMPLGLVRITKTFKEEAFVLVSPRIGSLSTAWSRRFEFKNDGGQKSSRRRGGAEGDFYGMREWRNGDSRNRIHWRTSAKRNKLTVRQFEQRVNQDLVVVLDLWCPQANDAARGEEARKARQAAEERVESAISFAATLIVEHCKQGATHVVFASASKKAFDLHGLSSPVFRRELMEKLAMVDACSEDRLPEVLSEVLPLATSNAKIVLVSTQPRDLHDTDAFSQVWNDTNLRRGLSDIVHVDTTSADFHEWFQVHRRSNMAVSKSVGATDGSAELVVNLESPQADVSSQTGGGK